jgi:hypothetical protein
MKAQKKLDVAQSLSVGLLPASRPTERAREWRSSDSKCRGPFPQQVIVWVFHVTGDISIVNLCHLRHLLSFATFIFPIALHKRDSFVFPIVS